MIPERTLVISTTVYLRDITFFTKLNTKVVTISIIW